MVEIPADLFHLPLSALVAQQFLDLAIDINSLPASSECDHWTYIWDFSHFSTAKAYKHLIGQMPTHPAFRWLWKSACQNKHKVFFWLLLKDRLSTRALLRRRNMHLPSYSCVCCTLEIEETLAHLFISCPFAQACWATINVVISMDDPFIALEDIRMQLAVPFFMDIIVTFCWNIWMQRNDSIFKGLQPQPSNCLQCFKLDFALVILLAMNRYKSPVLAWINNLV